MRTVAAPLALVGIALAAVACRAPELPLSPALVGQRLDELARRTGQVLLAPPANRDEVYAQLLGELAAAAPLVDDAGRQTTARVLGARLRWERHLARGGALDAEALALRLAADGLQDQAPASLQARVLSLLGAARRGAVLPVARADAAAVDVEALIQGQVAWQRPLHPRLVRLGWDLLAGRDRRAAPVDASSPGPEPGPLACALALADLGLHGLGITPAQAEAVLVGQAGLDAARARAELATLRADPGRAVVALLGAQALATTLDRLRALQPGWDAAHLAEATVLRGPLDEQGLQVLEHQLAATSRPGREDAGARAP